MGIPVVGGKLHGEVRERNRLIHQIRWLRFQSIVVQRSAQVRVIGVSPTSIGLRKVMVKSTVPQVTVKIVLVEVICDGSNVR